MGFCFYHGASVGVGSPKGSLQVMKVAQISESTYMYIFTFNLSLDRSFFRWPLCDGFKIVSCFQFMNSGFFPSLMIQWLFTGLFHLNVVHWWTFEVTCSMPVLHWKASSLASLQDSNSFLCFFPPPILWWTWSGESSRQRFSQFWFKQVIDGLLLACWAC